MAKRPSTDTHVTSTEPKKKQKKNYNAIVSQDSKIIINLSLKILSQLKTAGISHYFLNVVKYIPIFVCCKVYTGDQKKADSNKKFLR